MKLLTVKRHKKGTSSATHYIWEEPSGSLVESSVLYINHRVVPNIICLPCSVGCRMGCRFCAMHSVAKPTPLGSRSLWDIVNYSLDELSSQQNFQVTFMGQGEPFECTKQINQFCYEFHVKYPKCMIGISTVGIAKGIRRLMTVDWRSVVKLQISLHALPSTKRQRIIPAEKEFPVLDAIDAGSDLASVTGAVFALNYVLIDGFNDSLRDANKLANAVRDKPFYVKVSRLNPCQKSTFKASSKTREDSFCHVLESEGVRIHRFISLGTEIGAGCGQTSLQDTYPIHRSES